MAIPIELSAPQKSVLEAIANHERYSQTLRARARAILAATEKLDTTRISQRVRLDEGTVRSVIAAWTDAAKELRASERFGSDLLRRKIEMILTDVDQPGGGCCGCSDDDEDEQDLSELTDDDVQALAQRVYDLLRHDLRVQRDRLPG